LLRAIKQGDWVLLDELNLASQSVLEGLNSCLDHRASVFIPELGKTFECPPTFRVFAAQNPLAQGGGRKGLPKSFLNRFTKVYVESLTEEDLHSILSSRFPVVPSTLSKSMIMFNNKVHSDVVEKHEYGDGGSPWEFNLRDVFRWCELVVASGDGTRDHVARFASQLYLQRFRSVEDRKRLNLCFQDHFGVDLVKLSVPELRVTDDFVCIGEALLERRIHSVGTASEQLFGEDSVVLRSLLCPLESVARCVAMKWPVLFVGQSGSGKSWLLKSLAELINAPLIHVSLTPATDVNELVGCFEQVDIDQDEKEAIQCFCLLHDAACKYLTESEEQLLLLQRISHLYHSIDDTSPSEMSAIRLDLASLFAAGARASNKFHQHSQKHLETVRAVLESIENTINHRVDQDKKHFRWVDGILVNAMTHGYWIHLENVNLCPASVLDRLNPVMEQDGELLLTECGVQDSGEIKGAGHRVVKQHPDFRIFLSMNPEHGEISRAMRNRCVEISLIPPSAHGVVGDTNSMSTTTTVDALDLLSLTGVRSSPLGVSMLKVHNIEVASARACGTELPSTRHLHEWGNLVSGFCTRGWDIQSTLALSLRLSYELNEGHTRRLLSEQLPFDNEVDPFALSQSPLLRWGWSFHPHQARLDFDLRPVKAFTGSECAPSKLSKLLQIGLTELGRESERAVISGSSDDISCDVQNQSIWFPMIRNNLLVMYLGKSSLSDLSARSRTLDGYEDTVSCYVRFMTFFLRNCILRLPQSPYDVGSEAAMNDGDFLNIGERLSAHGDVFLTMHLNRMTQFLREKIAYRRVTVLDQSSMGTPGLTVLEASMCLYDGKMERSLVSCPATPIMYPFFRALDDWIKHLNTAPECVQTMRHSFQLSLEKLLSQRDQFWLYLNESSYHFSTPSSFLGFDESGFIVHWIWLKKKLNEFSGSSELLNSLQTSSVEKLKQRLDVLVETLDRVIFDTADDLSGSADTLWKKGGHPLVPRRADQWETIARLKEVSWACALFEGQLYNGGMGTNSRRVVNLGDLIRNNHPAFFVSTKERGDLLAALCTCYWASTDEVGESCPSGRAVENNKQLHTVMSMQLIKKKNAFAAQVRALKVDLEITTVENLLDMEVLASLREGTGVHDGDTDQDFLQSLLFRFAQIQVSPIAEFWCAWAEAALIESLAKILFTSTGPSILGKVINLLPRLKNFVRVALAHTLLAVVDLRPYQTLIWVASGSSESAESITHLLQCLLPRMMTTISRHKWSNSFNDLSVISEELELPPLWVSDTTASPEACVPSSSDTFHEGPPALHHQVNAQVMFRLVGSEISFMLSTIGKSTYATVENHTTRKKQAQTIVELLSSLTLSPHEHKVPYEVQYLVAHTLETLIDFFPDGSGREILTALKNPRVLEGLDDDYVSDLLAKCDHPLFRDCVETIVSPLLSSLRSAFRGASRQENVALCWVYIGLLRMNLLVPRSPLDPGKKPIAKVLQLSRHLHELQGRLVAARFDSSLLQGVTTPTDPTYQRLTEEADRVIEKRSKQERKTVERTSGAPPFIDLYRESRQFLKAVAGTDGVPALIRAILAAGHDQRENWAARNRELNWQTTASSFCSRMLGHFAPYEDVILPFVHAVQNVRDGIRVLANHHLLPNENSTGLTKPAFESLLAFPSGNVFEHNRISKLTALLGALSTAQTSNLSDIKRCNLALSLAILCRIDIQKRSWVRKFKDSAVRSCHSVFHSITVGWTLERDSHKSESPGSAEDVFENEYREQFPNHSQEFHSLLHAIEVGDDSEELKAEEIEVIDLGSQITEAQIQMLCCLHRDLFSQRLERAEDKTRARAFCAAYSAAYHLGQVKPLVLTTSSEDIEQIGGHIMALSLSSGVGSSRVILPDSSNVVDFHRDANPNEVAKASRPLEMLIARTSQLLTAFPGHSVLVALIRIADRVRKLPLSTTSLGKAMSGLEVILRKAQDWEQHASSLVKLGTPLEEMSGLVACWRKLELQSWATLLQARERRFANRARRHWPRLYSLLTQMDEQKAPCCVQKDNNCFVQAPVWVWKGLKRDSMGRFVSTTMDHDVDGTLFDLTKVMDTFLLISSLGEFQERLGLVETFATQISLMTIYDGFVDPWRAKVSRMLFSLWSFYSQFLPMLVSRLNELRRPIEARLRDEVKLAKWDEQSYYALAESSEKNHRKLMKLLREYDDVLELTVSSVLEKQLCHGVRSTESASDEPCNIIPPYKMMFPFFEQIRDSSDIEGPIESLSAMISDRVWTNLQALGLPCDKYVSQMDHYASRMASLVQKHGADGLTWSQVGAECASALSTNIFERIESLRKDKTTKPMKERALVDLFKALRKNGYLQTKWSVPEQIRQMAHLLQLPRMEHVRGILTKEQSETLGDTDKYFQRTTAEVNRLRSEVLILGSKYMSQRETQIMLSLAEHGLVTLCQQRCVLSRLLTLTSTLDKLLEPFDTSFMSLPLGQTALQERLEEFNEAFLSATENVKQLHFLMKMASPLVEKGNRTEAIRDMISVVESCLSSFQGYEVARVSQLLSSKVLSNAIDAGAILEEVQQCLSDCQRRCESEGCFPSSVFTSCISEIQRALKFASLFAENALPLEKGGSVEVSRTMDRISLVVQKVLLVVQKMCKGSNAIDKSNEDEDPADQAIFVCHSSASREVAALDVEGVSAAFTAVIDDLRLMHDTNVTPKSQRDCCTAVVSDLSVLVRELLEVSRQRLVEYIIFSRSTAKLNYVLVRVFRVLVSKGYCADSITDVDGEGDVSGMNFEDDQDGTGMGEGDGKEDVTDQLESEEQLLGLKGEDQEDGDVNENESKQLTEEEAKQGMEMEGDFEGDMCDVPEQTQDDDAPNGDDDEEELEREMGDGSDPNEEVIDEKMWDNSDDEGDQNQAEEKFEKDSGVKGEALEDEVRTREDDKESPKGEPNETEAMEPNDTETTDQNMQDEPQINDDTEDKYEDKASGVDVRDEQKEADEKEDDHDEPMELDDELNLDESGAETDQVGDGMDIDETPAEDLPEGEEDGADVGVAAEEEDSDGDSISSDVDADALQTNGHNGDKNDEEMEKENDDDGNDEAAMPEVEFSGNNNTPQDLQGINAKDGKDSVMETMEEDEHGEDNDGQGEEDHSGIADESQQQASSGGTAGEGGDTGDRGESSHGAEMDHREDAVDAPNPFRDPGDATKFWHKKLRMIEGGAEEAGEEEAKEPNESLEENGDRAGEFEYASKEQQSTTQVLGEADEEEAAHLDEREETENSESEEQTMDHATAQETKGDPSSERKQSKNVGTKSAAEPQRKPDEPEDESHADTNLDKDTQLLEQEATVEEVAIDIDDKDADDVGNRVVTDLSQLNVKNEVDALVVDNAMESMVEEEGHVGISAADAAAARLRWSKIQGETHHLARRLCEKLRLVMEPLVATKLKGDYRTGKRINMKRVIGYIASGYRKDKIWLRRTKPAKRNYRVLLAVDNSESMHKSGAGEMALAAMATLAVGMSQLEIGELGVASFGEEMRLLHPFYQPFTSESGVNVVQNFPFDERRTRTALCVESALSALESQGDIAAMQLVFLISDGRIERDSRDTLRRLVREMVERNVLLVMIIVEGTTNGSKRKQDSIVHMKEVSFENGKPRVKQFIEDYPFPYYMVLDDMQSLPEILGDALRQWFEMIAQIQGNSK
jgi:MoxR-like ATPase